MYTKCGWYTPTIPAGTDETAGLRVQIPLYGKILSQNEIKQNKIKWNGPEQSYIGKKVI